MPLGWFDIHTAYALWYLFHSAVLLLVIVMLWRLFQESNGVFGLLLTTVLVLLLRSTYSTISHGQVNLLALLFLLLFWRENGRLWGGVWLALGVLVKPVLVFLLLYPVLRRQWRVLTGVLVASILVSLLTILVFGLMRFFEYFTANPIANDMPEYLYTEPIDQSLLCDRPAFDWLQL